MSRELCVVLVGPMMSAAISVILGNAMGSWVCDISEWSVANVAVRDLDAGDDENKTFQIEEQNFSALSLTHWLDW